VCVVNSGIPSRSNVELSHRVAVVLLVCGLAGASNFILIKELVGQITPVQLVGARVVLAGATLSAVLLVLGKAPSLDRPMLKAATVLALIDAVVPYLLIALAAPHILASTSALLIATMPLFTGLAVSITDRTRLPASIVLGLALGAVGVAILAGPAALQLGDSKVLAMLAVLVASSSYAVSAVYSRAPLRTIDPIELSAVKFVIASVVLVPVILAAGGPASYARLDLEGWLALFAIGFVVTGLARCGYVWVIRAAGSISASLLTYVIPVATLGLAWILLGEMFSVTEGIGALLVGASTTCVIFGPAIGEALRKRWDAITAPRPVMDSEEARG
jgi:drug/metabolite transporter (DMT)-like permease